MTTPLGLTAVRLLALAQDAGDDGLIHVSSSEGRAEQLAQALAGFAPDLTVAVLPPWDCLPYDRASPSREVMGRRLAALRTIAEASGPRVLITTPDAAVQRLPAADVVDTVVNLRVGEPFDPAALEAFALRTGHVFDERIDEPGEIALRGQVVEIYPADQQTPYRLDLTDGVISAIRAYDPVSQRTTAEAAALLLAAASEVVLPEDAEYERHPGIEHTLPQHGPLRTVFDLMPKARLSEGPNAEERRQVFMQQVADAYADRLRAPVGEAAATPSPPEKLYLSAEEWTEAAEHRLAPFKSDDEDAVVPRFAAERRTRTHFTAFAREQIAAGHRLVLTAATDRDRRALAKEAERALETTPRAVETWAEALAAPAGAVVTLLAELDAGFTDLAMNVAVVAAPDLLGARAQTSASGPATAAVPWLDQAAELHTGDLVVHLDHGVGVLNGLEPVAAGDGPARDTVSVGYAAGGKLLLAVEEIGRLWRYGAEEGAVSLDRIDSEAWTKRRAQIYAEIAESARALVELAREREQATAPKLVAPRAAYDRFVGRFPFTETPDQLRAIEDSLADLARGRPMDRLVIADVGYGKTEVALRAAAAAALAGKQVAVVAPTTVLARQHVQAFKRRFEGLDVEVAHLSRLVTPAEAKATKAGLADGSIRVVVGTHAVAGKGVAFADLGLMVIDEEQRFGAAQKTALRTAAEGVHVLTLTATPIPRTLQAALVGLQELSVITTPPARRRPIRTFNTPFDPVAVRGALLREKRRSGQSFVVVPRIEDMEPMAERLKALAPELTIFAAHGKMPAADVDDVMVRFAAGEGDVLLATNIIESGLDVPRANTMVIYRADLFGLAQLHQLRGRVGRGRVQGVCYLQTDPDHPLSEQATKRLGALEAFDRLGAGLAISAQDLDIRGAGDLLGDEQKGHVKLVGLELHQHLLGLALRQARGETVDDWTPELNVGGAGELPPEYIPESDLRLNLYARLAKVAEPHDVEALAEEIEDRFGAPPPPVRDLLTAASLRARCRALGIARVDAGPKAIALTFRHAGGEAAHADVVERTPALKWSGDRLILSAPSETAEQRLELVIALLDELA